MFRRDDSVVRKTERFRSTPRRSNQLGTEVSSADTDQLLSSELFQKIQQIHIRTQRLVTEAMAGEYVSAFKGRGMEFEQVREYQPGDDIRHIDWNVTARMNSPFVKEHREERELTVMLLVDVSASGAFGSSKQLKNEIAAEIAAVLAFAAIRNNDRVGLVLFTDEVESYIPPKKGRSHVWRVIREILYFQPQRTGTSIETALEFLTKVAPRRVVSFLISDFFDGGFKDRLRVAGRRHDMTAVTINDRREAELPALGLVEMEDAETGRLMVVDTGSRKVREQLKAQHREKLVRRRELLRSVGVGEIEIWTDEPYVDNIVRFFRKHQS